jgi:hypothetical protein
MIFGTNDPHVPDAGRETIDRALLELKLEGELDGAGATDLV